MASRKLRLWPLVDSRKWHLSTRWEVFRGQRHRQERRGIEEGSDGILWYFKKNYEKAVVGDEGQTFAQKVLFGKRIQKNIKETERISGVQVKVIH